MSHETIYRSLYVQARGALKAELIGYLRSGRQLRRSRYGRQKSDRRGQIPDAVSISERPPCVEDRAVPGHWEGDLLCGSNNSFIATLVERHSRYVMLVKVANKETQTVISALILERYRRHTPLVYWKPVATGASTDSDSRTVRELVPDLAVTVARERALFDPPVSPHLAARLAGAEIRRGDLTLIWNGGVELSARMPSIGRHGSGVGLLSVVRCVDGIR